MTTPTPSGKPESEAEKEAASLAWKCIAGKHKGEYESIQDHESVCVPCCAAALAAEREAAARIAKEHYEDELERIRSDNPKGHLHSQSMGYMDACTEIEAAIRRGGEKG